MGIDYESRAFVLINGGVKGIIWCQYVEKIETVGRIGGINIHIIDGGRGGGARWYVNV